MSFHNHSHIIVKLHLDISGITQDMTNSRNAEFV